MVATRVRRRRSLQIQGIQQKIATSDAPPPLPGEPGSQTSGPAEHADNIRVQQHRTIEDTVNKPTLRERVKYRFDNTMARGPLSIVGLLALVTLAFILILAVVVELVGAFPDKAHPENFGEIIWQNMLRALDSGTFAGDVGWPERIIGLIVTIGGIFVVASLIGIISSAFDSKVEDLRKGGSKVVESDHTLILGWSAKVFPIVSELLIANQSRRKATIVILADYDKIEMDDAIRAHFPTSGNTRIITRSADPMSLADLELGNPHAARSIIVLAPEGNDDPDSAVIKTTLALTNNPKRKQSDYHIVGEISSPSNLEAARLVGRQEAHWVLASDLISRITVQTCRQSGLSVVYTELLDFDGDEIYFSSEPDLVGKTYFDAQLAFADSAVMGIVKGEAVHINPDADLVIEPGDQLVLIAEDDSTIRLSSPGVPDGAAISAPRSEPARPEQTLVLGYNTGLHVMLSELAEYVATGSGVTVVADITGPEPETFASMPVRFRSADTTSRAVLESLDVASFDHIIVLAYKEKLDVQRADAKTLITLLHLRDLADREGLELNVVSEMLDDRNRELAEVTRADDFIVSDKLISLMLSQVSENKRLTDVFDTLFSADGSEIYLRPADLYVQAGVEVNFYTVLEAARRRGETAIGYRIAADSRNSDAAYGVVVNPHKAQMRAFGAGDKIIVLAED